MTDAPTETAAETAEEIALPPRSEGRLASLGEFWHYFAQSKGAVVGLIVFVLLVLMAIVAPWLAPYDPAQQFQQSILVPPFWQQGGSPAFLLGTDAVRDGVDVPGRSLRLIVFDRVPWPRPDILHKARRDLFRAGSEGKGRGNDRYGDMITRFRLKQAFGRLIRGTGDRGCFVILEAATPSRLLSAFPEAAPVKRCGLAEAARDIRAFVGNAS